MPDLHIDNMEFPYPESLSIDMVRKRPMMFIGDTDINGLHNLLLVLIDNAVNPVMAGQCKEIKVILRGGIVWNEAKQGVAMGPGHVYYMREALKEAGSALARGNRAIGTVVMLDGVIIGRG